MTIGAWVFVGIIIFIGLCIAGLLLWGAIDAASYEKGAKIGFSIGAAATLIITAIICVAFIWYRSNSASGQRALKDQESNLNGGISRTVSVYDINGELIRQYFGKFDIETDKDSYVLFDDEDGCRHIIYYTTGTIIIDEN